MLLIDFFKRNLSCDIYIRSIFERMQSVESKTLGAAKNRRHHEERWLAE
jgi:hypothetical protein